MIQRVDKSYLELSEALLNLGCAIWKMFPNHAEDIKIVLPKFVHKELFGECNGMHKVVVQGPFGQYRVEGDDA
jgi:hypothetical protein